MRALVLLATLLSPPEVQRPSRLQIDWTAPQVCPTVDELRERLRARLPSVDEPLGPGVVPLEVSASLTTGTEGFDVQLRLRKGEDTSERVLSSRDCSLLTDAIVLVIAVTLDPVATAVGVSDPAVVGVVSRPSEPEPAEPPADEPPADTDTPSVELATRVAPGPAIDAEPDAGDLRVGLRAIGGGGYGPTNTGYATVGGSVALLGDRFRVALDGRWVVRRRVVRTDGAGGQFQAWLIGAVGCFVPAVRSVEFPVCGGIEAGQILARGVPTLPVVEQAAIPHVALRVAPGLAWAPLERLAIGFDVELAVPVTRGEFVVDDVVVQRVAPVNVRGILGVELRLP